MPSSTPVSAVAEPTTLSPALRLFHRARQGLLRVPLLYKLIGANLLVAAAASAAFVHWDGQDLLVLGGLTLAGSLGLSAMLVRIALGPLDELETIARQLKSGHLVQPLGISSVADDRLDDLRKSFNHLLLQAEEDQARIRQLARLSLEMREMERADLADTLRQATAQELAALSMRLGAAATLNVDEAVAANILAAREIADRIVDEVGAMADSFFPALLAELGLPAALETLGRRVALRSGMEVTVETAGLSGSLPMPLSKLFFRVAEEAVRNTELHARARSLRVTLQSRGSSLQLNVEDDGTGFDPSVVERTSVGIGLFRVRELLAQAGGKLIIESAPGVGATIVAFSPVPENPSHGE